MSDETRYDEATVNFVAAFAGHFDPDTKDRCRTCKAWARSVLDALADAGLLMPPGGETREEWNVRWADVGHYDSTEHEASGDETTVRTWAANMRAEMAKYMQSAPLNIEWVKTARRTVVVWPVAGEPNDNWPRYLGPWVEVTE